jgi:ABC-2 type transport system permease protein
VAVGYLGLLLLGSATLAIGTLGSALARSQLVAIVVSAGFVVTLIVIWLLSTITDRALGDVFVALALWGKHYPPFQMGTLNLRDVAYYVLVTYVALYLATQALEAKRCD